jgi:hypothetical protein
VTILPSDLDNQVGVIRDELSDLHTCMPAEIVGVRDGKDARQFVDVLPTLQRVVIDADGEPINEAYPVIPMVPVGYAQGGGFFVSLPLAVGDIVLLVFAERSLDAWIESAKHAGKSAIVPGDVATHTLQGAIALPCGPAPRASLLAGVDAADMVIGTTSGTILQRWKADGSVVIAEGAGTDFVALAGLVMAAVNKLQSTFDGHTHPAITTATVGLAGPATVTVSPPSTTVGALDDVKAQKTKAT